MPTKYSNPYTDFCVKNLFELAAMSKKERERYDRDLDIYRDNYAAFKTAELDGYDQGVKDGEIKGRKKGRKEGRKEGIEEGKKEGRKEGRKEEKIDIARNLKQMGLDPAAIAEATKLSLREIGKIDD